MRAIAYVFIILNLIALLSYFLEYGLPLIIYLLGTIVLLEYSYYILFLVLFNLFYFYKYSRKNFVQGYDSTTSLLLLVTSVFYVGLVVTVELMF